MRSNRTALIVLNLVGGIAVLASYAWGIGGHPDARNALWGGVPDSLRPLYTVSMFSAAFSSYTIHAARRIVVAAPPMSI